MKKLNSLLLTGLLSTNISFAADNNEMQQIVPYGGKVGQYEVSLHITADDLKNALSSRYPSLFNGRKEVAETLISDLQKKMAYMHAAEEYTLIFPEARPYFEFLKRSTEEMALLNPQFHLQLQFLAQEIGAIINSNRFDLGQIIGYELRLLAAISDNPTPEALSLFRNFGGDEFDKNMRANWQSPISGLYINDDYNISYSVSYSGLSSRLRDLLDKEVVKVARLSQHYPIFGKGKLGLVTLIESFINRKYPLPVCARSQTAHGVPMTPLLFILHDLIHAKADASQKESVFETASLAKLSELAKDKIDVEKLIPLVAEYMIGKSNLIEDSMNTLLNLYFTHYLPQHSINDLKKIMVGFFELMHENLKLSPAIYNMFNIDNILGTFLAGPKNSTIMDPLNTDPITGKTSLTPEQALDAVLAAGITAKEQERYFYGSPFTRQDLTGKKYRVEIQEEPMLTTVMVKVAGGAEYTWEVNTLKYELSSSLDQLSLLKVAGLNKDVVPPSQNDLIHVNGRDFALSYLKVVEDNMDICREAFKTSALDLVGVIPIGEHKSIWRKFWDKSQKLELTLQAKAAKVS